MTWGKYEGGEEDRRPCERSVGEPRLSRAKGWVTGKRKKGKERESRGERVRGLAAMASLLQIWQQKSLTEETISRKQKPCVGGGHE